MSHYSQIIRTPLIYFPVVAASITDAAVALRRISQYLLAEELAEPFVLKEESNYAIEMVDGEFIWEVADTLEGKSKPDEKEKAKKATKKEKKSKRDKKAKKDAKDDEKDTLPTHSSRSTVTAISSSLPLVDDPEPFSLRSISLRIPKGSFVAIVGRVGAGKSSLLNAMIGEMRKVKGEVTMGGTIAYVPQQAWIMNASLRAKRPFWSEGR